MNLLLRRLAAILSLSVLLGCAGPVTSPYVPQPAADPERSSHPAPRARFGYPSGEVQVENHLLAESDLYRSAEISFPSVAENGQPDDLVRAVYHQSRLPGRRPLVIVLPIWGRPAIPSKRVASGLVEKSAGALHVLRVKGVNTVFDWARLKKAEDEEELLELLGQGVERSRANVVDLRRLIDWVASREEVDGGRVGLMGMSHGALTAGALLIYEPRLSAAALVLGGAHPHQILASCNIRPASTVAKRVEEKLGLPAEWYRAQLEVLLADGDPAVHTPTLDPSRALIVEAGRDTCIPLEAREDLWTALGRPERIVLPYDHKLSFISMAPSAFAWLRNRTWEFFRWTLIEG